MTKKERIIRDIENIQQKIEQLQMKLKDLHEQKRNLEDMEILQAVHKIAATPEELKEIILQITKNPFQPDLKKEEKEKRITLNNQEEKENEKLI